MHSIFNDLKREFQHGTVLTRIILINVIVFLIVNIVDHLLKLTGSGHSLVYYLALPGNVISALKHGWTFITYMFLHDGLMHILFNMLWLYWLGKIFVEYLGSRRLVGVYLLGGITGGLLYILASMVFPFYFYNTFLLGASAGVMAVVIAIAILLPDYVIHLLFFGGVKLKYLALASFIITSILDISQNTGGKISHIGGALFGMIFILQYKKGKDLSVFFIRIYDRIGGLFRRKSRIKVAYRKKSDSDYNEEKVKRQQKIDGILDKISKAGYESLTKEEKDFLFKASNKKL